MAPAQMGFEKPLPSNLEAERAVLGVVLLDDKAIHTVAEILRKEDFCLESHRKIWQKMLNLAADGLPIDPITLKDELQRSDELEKVGGAAYLTSLTDGLPRASNVEHYARIVKEKAALRRIIQFSHEATRRSFEGECSPQEILAELQEQIFRIASSQPRSGFRTISESLPGTLQ